jgi:hypothetical protein
MKNQLKDIKSSLIFRKKFKFEKMSKIVKFYQKYLILKLAQTLCSSNILSIFLAYFPLVPKNKIVVQGELRGSLISKIRPIYPPYSLKSIDLQMSDCFRDLFKLCTLIYEGVNRDKIGLIHPLPILLLINNLLLGVKGVEKIFVKILGRFTKNSCPLQANFIFPAQFMDLNINIIGYQNSLINNYFQNLFVKCLQ